MTKLVCHVGQLFEKTISLVLSFALVWSFVQTCCQIIHLGMVNLCGSAFWTASQCSLTIYFDFGLEVINQKTDAGQTD